MAVVEVIARVVAKVVAVVVVVVVVVVVEVNGGSRRRRRSRSGPAVAFRSGGAETSAWPGGLAPLTDAIAREQGDLVHLLRRVDRGAGHGAALAAAARQRARWVDRVAGQVVVVTVVQLRRDEPCRVVLGAEQGRRGRRRAAARGRFGARRHAPPLASR